MNKSIIIGIRLFTISMLVILYIIIFYLFIPFSEIGRQINQLLLEFEN